MDTGTVRYIGGFGGLFSLFTSAVIFAFMSCIDKQSSAFVGMYVVVDRLPGDMDILLGKHLYDLRRRPLLICNPLFYTP